MAGYAVLSDIHGNMQALEAVHKDLMDFPIKGIILLGDLIDYGMQSNEVIAYIQKEMQEKIICSIWGNHEQAVMSEDFGRFSSLRGANSAKRTASILTAESRKYLNTKLIQKGCLDFQIENMHCLAVHGSMKDYYWKAILPNQVNGDYSQYDIVFSGHSHYSHMFTEFYKADNPQMRNSHVVFFINPGSVGQPRNHHPEAQYAVFDSDTMSVHMRSVAYDIKTAMSYFEPDVDIFYRDRLKNGI